MYWNHLEVRRGAMGWSWVGPDGQMPWLCYPVREDQKDLIRINHECWMGGHLRVDCTTSKVQKDSAGARMGGGMRVMPEASTFLLLIPLQVLMLEGPWNLVVMDLMGPLLKMLHGNLAEP